MDNGYLIDEVFDKNGNVDYSKWLKPDGSYRVVVSYPHLSAKEIEEWVERYYKEFYFRPRYIAYKLKQSLLSFEEFKRNIKAFKTMVVR